MAILNGKIIYQSGIFKRHVVDYQCMDHILERLPGRNVCRGEERRFAKPRCLVPCGDIVFFFACWPSNLSSHVSTGTETAGNCGDFEPILSPAEEITDKDLQIVQSIFDKVHEEETKEVRSGNPTRFFQ